MTRLISNCTSPNKPVVIAVREPTMRTKERADSVNSNKGDILASINTPAVTIVAAWIKAEIGVGPSIESGSQT